MTVKNGGDGAKLKGHEISVSFFYIRLMAWDKKHYKACKLHMDHVVANRPWCCDTDVMTWLQGWTDFMKGIADSGDYEGAQAAKDAIFDFIKNFTGKPIPKEAMLVFK